MLSRGTVDQLPCQPGSQDFSIFAGVAARIFHSRGRRLASGGLVGRRLLEVYPAFEPLVQAYVEVVRTGVPLVIDELPYTDVIDGVTVSGFYALHVSRFGDGVLVVSRDVTEQRRAHRALAETVAQFEAAQRLASIGVWTLDLATDEVRFSDELRRLCGDSWRLVELRGLALAPIHRLPHAVRPAFGAAEALLGRTPLKHLASYHLVKLEKLG